MYKADSDKRILLIVLINRLLGIFFDSPVRVFADHEASPLSHMQKLRRPKKAAKAVKHFNLNAYIL